jgi:hypothetical protein
MSVWDNGWVTLQVVSLISAGLSILLISPITVFIYAGVRGLIRGKQYLDGQRKMKRLV